MRLATVAKTATTNTATLRRHKKLCKFLDLNKPQIFCDVTTTTAATIKVMMALLAFR